MRRLIIAAIVMGSLAGCGGGSRVEVRDATTGYLVGGARIEATLTDGRSLTLGTTGNDGAARIAPPPHVDYLFVSAAGYKPARAGAGDTRVALQPAWLGSFMDGGAKPRAGSPDAQRRPCHCPGRAR